MKKPSSGLPVNINLSFRIHPGKIQDTSRMIVMSVTDDYEVYFPQINSQHPRVF